MSAETMMKVFNEKYKKDRGRTNFSSYVYDQENQYIYEIINF